MKVNISMAIAVLAIIISITAIVSGFVMQPALSLDVGSVGENELADNSVTGAKVADGTLTNADIEDNSIMLLDLSAEVIEAITGVDIANNSISSAKIADGTITNDDISDSADIEPDKIIGTAWTADNDGSGSDLDADTVDGINGSQFARNDIVETRYYTIPACGFRPKDQESAYSHLTYGTTLRNMDPAFESQSFFAPVYLPHGAQITKMTVRYRTTDNLATGTIYLYKHGETLSTIVTSSIPYYSGLSTNHEISISETVDNNNQAYYIRLDLDPVDEDEDIWLEWVCITYTVTNPLP